MLNLLTRLFGSRNDRIVRGYEATVRKATAFENALKALGDEALSAKTDEFRKRLADGEKLNDLAPEAFAVVREAAQRTLKMRHFDVQLIGGLTLNDGRIAEMRTGEGKTLMSTLAAYLNALTGEGVHVVTVNEYLAQRDADWMGPIYRFLKLTVGVITQSAGLGREARRLCLRHHLRHQQRIRLRLPARQPGVQPRRPRAAQAGLRHRRRSGLHPHRRGAHAADHLRPGRREHRAVLTRWTSWCRGWNGSRPRKVPATTASTRNRSRRI